MKTRSWILAISSVVVLAFLVGVGQFAFSTPIVKSSDHVLGMGDLRRIENQQAIPVTGGSEGISRMGMADFRKLENQAELSVIGGFETALRVRMGDLRSFETRQDVRVGIGDLRKLESDQIFTSTVGMGDLRRFEAGQ